MKPVQFQLDHPSVAPGIRLGASMSYKGRLWITWETQRRSTELAEQFGCRLVAVNASGLLRYPTSVAKTIAALLSERPTILFAQNPSIFLAVLACTFGRITDTRVVIDRHSNFIELSKHPAWSHRSRLNIRRRIFSGLSRYTLRHAELTIVTNESVADLVRAGGGRPVILPDPIPSLSPQASPQLGSTPVVFVISSFAADEPVAEIMEAARQLGDAQACFVFSGNPKRGSFDWRENAPGNVKFTGFLPTSEYIDMLFRADIVMVLTTVDDCLLCGCYEALAAEKPLITSNTEALQSYFTGAQFVGNDAASIAEGVSGVLGDLPGFAIRAKEMRTVLEADWNRRFAEIEASLSASS